ncbi:hypothetical protein BJD55_gp154 [Gordonia phage Yvonnetastic]|uniref:Uncharacterized protein n=1 Tax=Gordonia phage Yvonnetastic TaxID=1821566 RepID=A0A142K929_9CAUD|nr:hypothetical protein BJD55_gp154 [Gordonia phage Yvonnetastic]AMS02612.1 hypothetical protein SEA_YVONNETASTIC_68 [Gordonia phage Yvonnetastic]
MVSRSTADAVLINYVLVDHENSKAVALFISEERAMEYYYVHGGLNKPWAVYQMEGVGGEAEDSQGN